MRVLLVDDHVLFREGIAHLLHAQPYLKVVGEASTVREAIEMARELQPDLILMDFGLPDGTGLDATRAILAERPETKIVFLTVHEEDDALFAAIRIGAMGYILKSVSVAELLDYLRRIRAGEAAISPAMAMRIMEEFSRLSAQQDGEPNQLTTLTTRELEVLRELSTGATNREIAARLTITENTVKNHVRNILAKLHLKNRREAAFYARRRGLGAPSDDPPRKKD